MPRASSGIAHASGSDRSSRRTIARHGGQGTWEFVPRKEFGVDGISIDPVLSLGVVFPPSTAHRLSSRLTRAEESVASVAQARQDVTNRVQLAVEGRGVDTDIRMSRG